MSCGKRHQWSPDRLSYGTFEKTRILIVCMPQIKNAVSTAYALATQKEYQVDMSHLEIAIAAGEDFEYDFRGTDQVGSLQSYA